MATLAQLEAWILESSDASNPDKQYQANLSLQRWTPDVALLFQILAESSPSDQVLFFALSVLARMALSPEQRSKLRAYLLFQADFKSTFIRNKAAMILASDMLVDFPHALAEDEMLLLAPRSPVLYLKTFETLLEDIRTSDDKDGVRRIKDLLKGNDREASSSAESTTLQRLFVPIVDCLVSPEYEVQILAIQTVKAVFIWTDMEYLGSDNAARILHALLLSLERPACQLDALDAWNEWITSSTMHKESFNLNKVPVMMALLEKLHQLDFLPYLGEAKADVEIVIAAAKVVDTMGVQIFRIDRQRMLGDGEQQLNHMVLDLFFRALSYRDIDVSSAVLTLCGQLVSNMERDSSLKEQHVPRILNVLYQQMRYPDDFGYDYEDEADAEEEMYRTELCKVYNKLVRASPEMCLQFVCEGFSQALASDLSQSPTPDVECMLRLLYHYCEGIRPPPGLKVVMKNETFCSLLVELHKSTIASHPHREVLCLYYEIAVRYHTVYKNPANTTLLARILEVMSGPQGLQHPHPRVRSRCCYLLLRLVKSVANLLRPYVETAVSGILGFLSSHSVSIRAEDSLYLFETVGLLLGKTELSPASQQHYLARVMAPHMRSIEDILQYPNLLVDKDHFGEILANSIASMAHLSKGFREPTAGIQDILSEALHVTLGVLETLPTVESIRGKSMVLLQRMFQCLGSKTLPLLPRFLVVLIDYCSSEDVLFVAQVLNQVCIKFKSEVVNYIDGAILPFMRKCHELVMVFEDATAGTDVPPHLRTEQLSVKKLIYTVLHHIVTHGATDALVSPTNVSSFELFLQTMCNGAVQEPDPVVQKSCIRFFRELVEQWSAHDGNNLYQLGLMAFVLQTFLTAMLRMIHEPSFDENDASQARLITEFSRLLFSIKEKSRVEDYYRSGFVKSLADTGQLPIGLIERFAGAVDAKSVEECLKEMLRIIKRST